MLKGGPRRLLHGPYRVPEWGWGEEGRQGKKRSQVRAESRGRGEEKEEEVAVRSKAKEGLKKQKNTGARYKNRWGEKIKIQKQEKIK